MKSERPREAINKRKTLRHRRDRILAAWYNFFFRDGLDYKALDPEQSLKMLHETRKSYIRFGNGESEILVGLDMSTQQYDKELEQGLVRIIKEYSTKSNYLLGLTNWCLQGSVSELKAGDGGNLYRIWRFMRYVFHRLKMERGTMPYLEADMFRVAPVGLPTEKIEPLWEDRSNIIIVYNNEKNYEVFKERHPGIDVYFVKIPDKNFFSVLPETEKQIRTIIKENSLSSKDLAVLISAGPGSNILCYNLCKDDPDILCYDMGNYFYMRYGD